MPCVRISDQVGGYLSFDLREILTNIESIGPTLHWYVMALEGRARPGSGISVVDLEREISAASHGKLLTWMELTKLADGLVQTINCVVVGARPNQEPPRMPLEEK